MIARLALLPCVVLGLTHPALAEGRIAADYAVSFIGIPIGTGQMVATTDGQTYRTTLNARVTGVAAMFVGGTGTAVSTGRILANGTEASGFNVSITSGGKTETVEIAMGNGAVSRVTRNPDKPPHPRATPVPDSELRGVLDPLSSGIFVAGGTGPVTGAAACDRRQRIYNGRERFDLIYSFVQTRQVDIGGYRGEAAVCSMRFEPVAGYRTDRQDIQNARRRSAEVVLVPVAGTRTLIPAQITLNTGFGTGIARATRLALDPGLPAQTAGRRATAQ